MVGGLTAGDLTTKWVLFIKRWLKSVPIISSATLLATIILFSLHFAFPYISRDQLLCPDQAWSLEEIDNNNAILKENTTLKRLNIVIQFPVIINHGSDSELVLLRQQEYVVTLATNLAHPQVETIHILLENTHDKAFIKSLKLEKSNKIVYHSLNRRMLYADAFKYVSDFLQGQTAVIMNADCYIGYGFEKLNPNILIQNTIYALTRHESGNSVKYCKRKDFCSLFAKYIGSHDAFIMRFNKPLPKKLIEKLTIRPDIEGVEKVVIFVLRSTGGFTVRNPCRIIYVFHNHCTNLRHGPELRLVNGKRINNAYISHVPVWKSTAPFSGL